MTGHRVSLTLDSNLDSVNTAEKAASDFAASLGLEEEVCHGVAMAVREAAVNAVLHGNAYDPNKKVMVVMEKTPQSLVITIADQGRGLDPAAVPDPLSPENLLKQSGRGIFLIKAFMDEVQFRSLGEGTEIKLIKHVPGKTADHKENAQ
jgi:serine/threonine-protein kinase RsbW